MARRYYKAVGGYDGAVLVGRHYRRFACLHCMRERYPDATAEGRMQGCTEAVDKAMHGPIEIPCGGAEAHRRIWPTRKVTR